MSRQKLLDSTHRLFDKLHEEGVVTRAEAYRRLAKALNKTSAQVHFGSLTPFELLVARKVVKRLRAQARRTPTLRLARIPHSL